MGLDPRCYMAQDEIEDGFSRRVNFVAGACWLCQV